MKERKVVAAQFSDVDWTYHVEGCHLTGYGYPIRLAALAAGRENLARWERGEASMYLCVCREEVRQIFGITE